MRRNHCNAAAADRCCRVQDKNQAGSHWRIVLKDLLAYRKHQEQESDAAMAELAREAQELGLGYDT